MSFSILFTIVTLARSIVSAQCDPAAMGGAVQVRIGKAGVFSKGL